MIERWEQRLAAMDHRKGTTDKMRKEAMLAEIKDLRAALNDPKIVAATGKDALAAARRELTEQRRRTKEAQANAAKWRAHFSKLRKLLLEVQTE